MKNNNNGEQKNIFSKWKIQGNSRSYISALLNKKVSKFPPSDWFNYLTLNINLLDTE